MRKKHWTMIRTYLYIPIIIGIIYLIFSNSQYPQTPAIQSNINIDEATNTDKVQMGGVVIASEKAKYWHGLGNEELNKGNNKQAEYYYDKALKEDQASSDIYASLAAANYLLNKYSEAKSNWNRSLELDEHNARALNGLAALAYMQGQYSESVRYGERALQINKQDDAAIWGLALSYEAIGKVDLALQYYKMYLLYSKSSRNSDYANQKLNELVEN